MHWLMDCCPQNQGPLLPRPHSCPLTDTQATPSVMTSCRSVPPPCTKTLGEAFGFTGKKGMQPSIASWKCSVSLFADVGSLLLVVWVLLREDIFAGRLPEPSSWPGAWDAGLLICPPRV